MSQKSQILKMTTATTMMMSMIMAIMMMSMFMAIMTDLSVSAAKPSVVFLNLTEPNTPGGR